MRLIQERNSFKAFNRQMRSRRVRQWVKREQIDKQFCLLIPPSTIVFTPPCDSASNPPQTQWVAMVAQTVVMATMML